MASCQHGSRRTDRMDLRTSPRTRIRLVRGRTGRTLRGTDKPPCMAQKWKRRRNELPPGCPSRRSANGPGRRTQPHRRSAQLQFSAPLFYRAGHRSRQWITPRMDLALRLGRRLSRSASRKVKRSRRPNAPAMARTIRSASVRRHGTDRRACRSEMRGPRLASKEHLLDQRGTRLMAVSRRNQHDARADALPGAKRTTSARSLRQLQTMPGCLPHSGVQRPLCTRSTPMHFVPHDRAARCNSRSTTVGDGRGSIRLRHLPGRLSVESQISGDTDTSFSAAPNRAKPRK